MLSFLAMFPLEWKGRLYVIVCLKYMTYFVSSSQLRTHDRSTFCWPVVPESSMWASREEISSAVNSKCYSMEVKQAIPDGAIVPKLKDI